MTIFFFVILGRHVVPDPGIHVNPNMTIFFFVILGLFFFFVIPVLDTGICKGDVRLKAEHDRGKTSPNMTITKKSSNMTITKKSPNMTEKNKNLRKYGAF